MTNLERRLRKLEAWRPIDGDIVIQIEYVNEPSKCFESEVRPREGPSGYGTRVTSACLREDDRNS